jgi:membrane-bound inhibitor of C-type lysozyme
LSTEPEPRRHQDALNESHNAVRWLINRQQWQTGEYVMQHLPTSLVSFGCLLLVMGAADEHEIRYACADDTQLSVTFSSEDTHPGTARLTIAGSPVDITLPQVPSANGGRYARDRMELRIKGSSARLSRTGSTATTCHVT